MAKVFIGVLLITITTAQLVDSASIKQLLQQTTIINQKYDSLSASTNATTGNDISYCGEYKSKCMSSKWLSLTSEIQLSGMMHHLPVYAEHTLSVYSYQQCEKENKMQSMVMKGSLQNSNEINEELSFTFETIEIIFHSKTAFEDLKCGVELEVDVRYDITTLDCKDKTGQNPFQDALSLVHTTKMVSIMFNESGLSIKTENGEVVKYERSGDAGCVCSTSSFPTSIDLLKPFKTIQLQTPLQQIQSLVAGEDQIPYCGSYEGVCRPEYVPTARTSTVVRGKINKLPEYLTSITTHYSNKECQESGKSAKIALGGKLEDNPESVTFKTAITFDKVTGTFYSEDAIKGITCKTPLELNKEYDLTTLECVNECGIDPFEVQTGLIGFRMKFQMIFDEKSITMMDGREQKRIGEEGCEMEFRNGMLRQNSKY